MVLALFQVFIAPTNFQITFLAYCPQSTLNKQRLDIGFGSANSGGFLLPGALVVLWRKIGPGAKMLGGREHGHIHSDLRDDADSCKKLHIRHRHNKVELRKELLGNRKEKRFQIGFTEVEAVHIRTDNAELFSLFGTQLSVYGGQHFLISNFHAFSAKSGNNGDPLGGFFQ